MGLLQVRLMDVADGYNLRLRLLLEIRRIQAARSCASLPGMPAAPACAALLKRSLRFMDGPQNGFLFLSPLGRAGIGGLRLHFRQAPRQKSPLAVVGR